MAKPYPFEAARRALGDAIEREKTALATLQREPESGAAGEAYVEAILMTDARALAYERACAALRQSSSAVPLPTWCPSGGASC